jgi:hypothetical protein
MYRLKALEELESKGALNKEFYSYNASDTIKYASLKGKTVLMSPCGISEEIDNKIGLLEDQFSAAPTFLSLRIEGTEIIKNIDYSNCYFIPQIIYDEYFLEHSFVLLDTNLQIRNYFNADEESFKQMVEHLAIILPREKEKKIEYQQNK